VIGQFQIKKCVNSLPIDTDYIISLSHHPISYLQNFDQKTTRGFVDQYSTFHFSGHLHDDESTGAKDYRGRECILSMAGSSTAQNISQFCIYEIDFGKRIFVKIPKKYIHNGFGHWIVNRESYPELKDDKIEFKFEKKEIIHNDFDLSKNETKLININEIQDSSENIDYTFVEESFFITNFDDLLKNSQEKIFFERLKNSFEQDSDFLLPSIKELAYKFAFFLIRNQLVPNTSKPEIFFDEISCFKLFLQSDTKKNKIIEIYKKSVNIHEKPVNIKKQSELINHIKNKKETWDQIREIKKETHIDEKVNDMSLEQIPFPHMFNEIEETPVTSSNEPVEPDIFRRYGLKINPFSDSQSLQNIKEEYYSEIIVKTKPFQYFINSLERDVTQLKNKKFLILGLNGTGKTTLFEYCIHLLKIHHRDLLPIYLSISPKEDHYEIYKEFIRQLKERLLDIIKEKLGITIEDTYSTYEGKDISFLIKKVIELEHFKGLFVFIDNLNHFIEHVDACLNFLELLNIVYEDIKQIKDFDITISVAGAEIWKNKIETNPRLSPYSHNTFVLGSISLDEAYEMVQKRFNIASINPDEPVKCSKEYIYEIYQRLKKSPTGVIFRNLISYLNKKLQNGEFGSFELSIEEDLTSLKMIFSNLGEYENLEGKFADLYSYINKNTDSESSRNYFIRKFTDIILLLYRNGMISVKNTDYTNNREYVLICKSIGLIEEKNVGKNLVVVLNEDLREFFKKHKTTWGIEPKSYLRQIIGFDQSYADFKQNDLIKIDNLIKSVELQYPSIISKNLVKIRDEYGAVLDALSKKASIFSYELANQAYKLIFRFVQTLIALSLSDQEQESYKFRLDERSFNKMIKQYEDSWAATDTQCEELYAFNEKYESIDFRNPAENELYSFYQDFKSLFTDIRSNFSTLIASDKIFKINNFSLSNIIKKALNQVRRNIVNNSLDLAISDFDIELRKHLFNCMILLFSILFGEEKWRRGLPQTVNLKLIDRYGPYDLEIDDYIEVFNYQKDYLVKLINKKSFEYLNEFKNYLSNLEDEKYLLMNSSKIVETIKNLVNLIKETYDFPKLFLENKIPFAPNRNLFPEINWGELKIIEKMDLSDTLKGELLKEIQDLKEKTFKIKREYVRDFSKKNNQSYVSILIHLYDLIYNDKKISLDDIDF